MLVVGLVGFVTSARDDDSFETGASTTVPGQAPVIWPLDDGVPADVLAAPETTVRAYLSEVAQVPADIPLGVTTTEGDRATVDYVLQDVGAQVSLRFSDGGWRVTQATNDAVDIIGATLVGDAVDVGIAPGPRGWSPMTLRTAIDAEGETVGTRTSRVIGPGAGPEMDIDTDTAAGSDEIIVMSPDPSAEPHSLRVDVPGASATQLHAVRLDVMSDHDGDPGTPDVVVAHASQAITGPDGQTATTQAATADPPERRGSPALGRGRQPAVTRWANSTARSLTRSLS